MRLDKVYEFTAQIKAAEGVDGAYIEFPYDVREEFGTNGRVPVTATFDGMEYRGSLVRMGAPCHILGMHKAIRASIGKQPGDTVAVTIRRDDTSREQPLPEALSAALAEDATASAFFAGLTDSQKNKFGGFIASAKKSETARERLGKAMDMLRRGEKMK